MTTNDFDRTARLWLEDGPTVMSDRALQAALDEIHVTRQRRTWLPARRFSPMTNMLRIAAVAAVLVVAVIGIRYFSPGDGGTGGSQASPSPQPTPRGTIVEGNPVVLEPGTYVTADPFLVRVTLTVPAGWNGHLGGPYMTQLTGPGEVLVFVFDKVYADPCHFDQGLLNPLPGPTVDDLATALTAVPGLDTTTPTEVTFGGYAGKQLTITAPASFGGCTLSPEGYALWELPLGALYTMGPGQGDRVWIIDVEGERVVVDASAIEGKSADVKAEVQGILDSIRLAPLEGTNPSASPTS
jgi:hypothetical protein